MTDAAKTNDSQSFQFISAGAGSGKTYTLTTKLNELLASGAVQPAGIIATTFTLLAAGELRERVRTSLIESGQVHTANAMGQAMIGTVNGVCGDLLKRFAFEAGMSPDQRVLEGEEGQRLFREALERAVTDDEGLLQVMNDLSIRLQIFEDYRPNWRSEVKAIVDAARANHIAAAQLAAFGNSSAESLLNYFPKPVDRDLNEELKKALIEAIKNIQKNIDDELDLTAGTKSYLDLINDKLHWLEQDRLSWSDWIKLSKSAPTKKSASLADTVIEVALQYEKHPLLHADIRDACRHLFSIAARSMSEYQRLKNRLGLVDFVDQETRLYELLDNPVVEEVLKFELQLLMVDEFQDTSPIQLALFLKLSQFAKQVIWVGDIKQSIYGFRGSDPELMLAVIRAITEQGTEPQILSESWRSRPELVEYVNAIFVPAFADALKKEQVALTPARKDKADSSVVEQWVLEGAVGDNGKMQNNKATQANALALGIDTLVNKDKRQIFDKQQNVLRDVKYADIAVLCRTNPNLAEVAAGLARQGIPVNYKRLGLLHTAEATLALACLRRLADAQDTLASAEIRCLIDSENPEIWLTDRLHYLHAGHKSTQWGEQAQSGSVAVPALQALAELRQRLAYLTPVEAFEQAILAACVRRTVCQWSGTAFQASQRLRNLDLLLAYAQQYVDHCDIQRLAATVPGLILWLHELNENEEDWQAESGGSAVQLCTHHGAKGLDSDIKPRLWGLRVKPRTDGFHLDEPLKDRCMNYWPAFFGGQSAGIAIKEAIEQSQDGLLSRHSAVAETKRLLYVSLTRARDLLILPFSSKKNTGEWLASLQADWMLPGGEALTLPNDQIIATQKKSFQQVIVDDNNVEKLHWLSSPSSVIATVLPARLQPSAMERLIGARIGNVIQFSDRVPLTKKTDITRLGKALHAVIATELIQANSGDVGAIERILIDHAVSENISIDNARAMATEFIEFIDKQFSPVGFCIEHPIQYYNPQQQRVSGWIDLLIETEEGWVLIDHKASPQQQSDWSDIALGYSGQLALYKEAIEATTDKPVLQSWIHFAVGGACVEVVL
jgi:ATP-dependent exoDNAse (exonuclease V) beta subunit